VEADGVGGKVISGQAADGGVSGPDIDAADLLDTARTVIANDARAVSTVGENLGVDFIEAARLLLACRGKVLVAGLGTSGATARRIAHLLSVTGTASLFVHAADGLHGGLGSVSEGDVLIAISKGGETDELNEFVRRARELGARIISMTCSRKAPLARLADVSLEVPVPDDVDPGGMIGTGSSLATCALGDALAMATMRARGYAWSSFEFIHPAGLVGKLRRGLRCLPRGRGDRRGAAPDPHRT